MPGAAGLPGRAAAWKERHLTPRLRRCCGSATCMPGTAKQPCAAGSDLCVGAGEIVALLGRNGSGRSTRRAPSWELVDSARARSSGGSFHPGLRPTFEIARRPGYVPGDQEHLPAPDASSRTCCWVASAASQALALDDMYQLFPQLGTP